MAERDAVEDLKYVEILRHLGYSTNFADALEHWIREAQAQRERAERAEEAEREIERRAIGRCAGCGDYVQASGCCHTQPIPGHDGEPIPFQCGPVEAVTAVDVERLAKERDELLAKLKDWEEREAAICPEDVGFEEYIRTLLAKIERMRAVVEAAEALLEESTYWTKQRCAEIGDSYGWGTDAEQAMREALAAYRAESCPAKEDEP